MPKTHVLLDENPWITPSIYHSITRKPWSVYVHMSVRLTREFEQVEQVWELEFFEMCEPNPQVDRHQPQ